jgi:secondary thiamine-phosphate synthase enzyme
VSKTSAVTSREVPLHHAPALAAGTLVVHSDTLVVDTTARVELIDLTDRVMDEVRRVPVREGLVSLWSLHTTTALFINESQQALLGDIKQFLEEFASHDRYYRHNDPAHSDCSRANADSHLRAMLLGHSLTLQLSGGELVLGHWQRILLAELDGPRPRSLRLQVLGIAA